jgi:hypothetical protein
MHLSRQDEAGDVFQSSDFGPFPSRTWDVERTVSLPWPSKPRKEVMAEALLLGLLERFIGVVDHEPLSDISDSENIEYNYLRSTKILLQEDFNRIEGISGHDQSLIHFRTFLSP